MNKIRTPFLSLCLALLAVLLYYYGFSSLYTYSLPVIKQDYARAIVSPYADKAELYYNASLSAYVAGKLDEAKHVLNMSYSEILLEDGTVKPGKEKLGSDIQFLIGKILQKQEKASYAIDAYKQSLRLDPDNFACKYDLEMLLSKSGGGAGDSQEESKDPKEEKPDEQDGNLGTQPGGKPKPKI